MLSPLAEAASFYIPEEILRVDAVREAPLEEVLDRLQVSSAGRAPVLYTHGFYVDFEKGCRRATILQENAELQDRFLWFSWPSDGALFNYTHDEADLYWSVPDLANVIADMETRFGAGEVNLVGHSLGGRGIVLALYDVAARHSDARIGDVVLLAPDIDFDIFRKLLPQIQPIVRSITVYVAAADRPLALSTRLHGYPRLGEVGNDIGRLSGVEVIDLSDLPVASPTGHLYHLYNAEIGHDLKQILSEGKSASERRNLVQVGDNLWKLQPVK
jgi:esterase/lipase superfamily enzyme